MDEYQPMPPVGILDPEEERRKREAAAVGTSMPAVRPPSQPAPYEGRNRDLALGATVQPTMPPVRRMEAPAAPELGPSTMPALPMKFQPGEPAKPASFGEPAAPPERHYNKLPGGGHQLAPLGEDAVQPNAMPPVQVGPQQKAYEDLSKKGEPKLTGWKKVLDTIGSIFPVGRAVEQAIPGSPQNYDVKLNQAALRAAKEQTLTEGERKLQQEPAEADLRRRNVESEITSRGDKDEAALAKIGMKRDQNGQIVPDENSEIFRGQQAKITAGEETAKNLNALREAQTGLADARTEVERAKTDPNSPAYKQAQQKLAMAQRAHDVAAANLGLHQQEFANRLHEQELIKPSGQSQSRGSAAQAVLDLIPDLEKNVRANAKEMGPLMGRLNRGEIAIGDVSPAVAKLYAAMKSFYALQPAVHGFRNAEFVKDFETALGTLERDPEAFIAGMQGLKPTLESVAREGKTSHKRIVERRDTGDTGEAGGMVWDAKEGKYVKKTP